jgi:hypothetical protein
MSLYPVKNRIISPRPSKSLYRMSPQKCSEVFCSHYFCYYYCYLSISYSSLNSWTTCNRYLTYAVGRYASLGNKLLSIGFQTSLSDRVVFLISDFLWGTEWGGEGFRVKIGTDLGISTFCVCVWIQVFYMGRRVVRNGHKFCLRASYVPYS